MSHIFLHRVMESHDHYFVCWRSLRRPLRICHCIGQVAEPKQVAGSSGNICTSCKPNGQSVYFHAKCEQGVIQCPPGSSSRCCCWEVWILMPYETVVRNITGNFPRLFGCWMSSLFDHKGHERRSVLVPVAVVVESIPARAALAQRNIRHGNWFVDFFLVTLTICS